MSPSSSTSAAVAAAALALTGAVVFQLYGSPSPLAWRDLSPRLRGIELPDPARRTFKVPAAIRDFQLEAMPGVTPRRVPLDWRREELVLVSPGPRSSTGYGVRIVSVTERRDRIDVVARETSPRLGDRVEARVTYPYRLLAIPRSGKRVHIVWEGQ
ncbi:MAG TPA: protease complex subunit PrcB family protein [Gaiellaceae bacterium]